MNGVETAAVRTLEDMRSMVALLRQDDLAQGRTPTYGISDIALLARDAGTGPQVVIQTSGDIQRLPAPLGSALFRAAREVVTNARRHAVDPTRVGVDLTRDGNTVRLRVHDNGRAAMSGRARRASPSYGLAGMRERFSLLGGHVHAGPDPSGGWTVEATAPVTVSTEEIRR